MMLNRRLLSFGLRKNCHLFGKINYGSVLYAEKYCNRAFFSSQKMNGNNNKNDSSTTNSNPTQTPPPLQNDKQFTPQQQQLIKTCEPDELFNTMLNLDPNHNFQKDLILAKKSYQRSTKQLRASILFQDLLKSEIVIPVYDTKGKPYTHMWIKNLFNVMFLYFIVQLFKDFENKDPKNKVFIQRTSTGKFIKSLFIGLASWFVIVSFWKYLKFQRRFVQSMHYDTKKQSFILKKRGFFGGSSNKQVSRFKLVYTQNEFLNKKGTNYFNLDTKEQYSIPYKEYWIKQDLFSHLIAQRIKL